MWENLSKYKKKTKNTHYFLDWMDSKVLTEEFTRRADDLLKEAEQKSSAVKLYKQIPQTAPWHAEGPTIAHGFLRMIAGIYAIVDGADLSSIEELARHKTLEHEITTLEETIKENAATLLAFALVHDIAKTSTISFDAPSGSLGEQEGFFQHKYRESKTAQENEIVLYNKLVKAFHAGNQDLNDQELVAKFYDKYEIRTHYYGHDKVGSSREYLEDRETISDLLRLGAEDRALLTFLIRNHMDALAFFSGGINAQKYELLVARCVKARFDPGSTLDLMLATSFLDSALGAISYRDQKFSVDLRSTIHFMLSEELAAGHRRTARRDNALQKEKQIMKDVLLKSNLSPDEVFLMLEVPFGPERGRVMKEIYSLVENGGSIDFGSNTGKISPKIRNARELFDHAQASR